MTRSSVHRSSLGEQLELYKNALIWDTRLSNRLNDYRAIEETEVDRKDVDEFRREFRESLRSPKHLDHLQRSGSSGDREKYTLIENMEDISEAWKYFGRQTTFHGVKNTVTEERRRYSRLLWLMLVLGMSGGMIYTVVVLLMEYYQYNTVTKTDVKINEQVIFPSVTLCNNCPYKNVDLSTDTPMYRLLASQSLLFRDLMPLNISDPETQSMLNTDVFEMQNKYSYTAVDLFFSALYEDVDLNVSEAFEMTETTFGRCFTFNGPEFIAKNGPRLATFDGRTSGLRLYVKLHQDAYFPYEDLTAGVRIFIAQYPETPRLRQDGIDVHPGTSTRLALNPVQYTFLPAPYKSYGDEPCENTDINDLRHKMVNASFYSYYGCLEQCHSYKASIACSCHTHLLYVPNLPRCTLGDTVLCFMEERENLTAADCDCPRSCTFTRYDSTMSASQIPSRVSADLLRRQLNLSSAAEMRYLLPGNDDLGEDYLEIRVYLETMMVRQERHESQYTFSSVFAFLGGQMGFFIGASLVSLAELFETILFSVYIFIHKKIMRMGQLTTISTVATNSTSTTKTQAKPEKKRAWQ